MTVPSFSPCSSEIPFPGNAFADFEMGSGGWKNSEHFFKASRGGRFQQNAFDISYHLSALVIGV
jgi:hypothetical protein